MKRAHRWWLAALAAVLLLPPLAALLLLWLVDPDSLRPAIERQAHDRFGMTLQLRGPLHWSLWPAFSVTSGEGALGDTAGAEGPPLSWRALRFTLQWPAWKSHEWRLEGVQVDGLQLRLRRDAQGRWNVVSLATASATPSTVSALHIDPLRLRDARIDVQAGADGSPWLVEVSQASVSIDTDEDLHHWTLRNLQLDARVNGAPLAAAQPLSLRTPRFDYRAGAGASSARVDVAPLKLDWAGATLQLRMSRPFMLAPLSGEGELDIGGTSLRTLLEAHRMTVPPMRDAAALQRYALSGHWRLADAELSLAALKAQLDDTHLQGTASGHWRAPAAWRIELEGDVLDVDRYRRPTSDRGAPFELPVAALRALPLTGTVHLRELRAAGSRARDARMTLQ